MPSATSVSLTMPTPKKRRREDEDDNDLRRPLASSVASSNPSRTVFFHGPSGGTAQLREPSDSRLSVAVNPDDLVYSSSSPTWSNNLNLHRKMIPLPATKRFRLIGDDHDSSTSPQVLSPTTSPADSNPPPPVMSPHILHPSLARPSNPSRTSSAAMLSPCHICHRKPTKKSDLDSFADCMGCGQRTCYVCIRQCHNWLPSPATPGGGDDGGVQDLSASFTMRDADDPEQEDPPSSERAAVRHRANRDEDSESWKARGHRDVICSRCCVERGSEGEVVCLGCLSGMESG